MQFKDYDASLFKTKRAILGVSCADVAKICRITRQTVSNIESERTTNAGMKTLIGLALDGLAAEQGHTALFEVLENE